MALKKKKIIKKKPLKKRKVLKKPVRKAVAKVKKPVAKKPIKKPAKKKAPAKKIEGKVVGKVTHYFPKVRAAVIKLTALLLVGDTIRVKGHTTDFTQGITSMQMDHVSITQAKKGAEIGLLVNSRARQHDVVYKI